MRDFITKNYRIIISIVLIICILSGMITTTVLLSRKNLKDWEYYNAVEGLDYYSEDEYFNAVGKFKTALLSYFNGLISSNLSGFINIGALYEIEVNSVVEALSSARISPKKLDAMATILQTHSLDNVFSDLKNSLTGITNETEFENAFLNILENFSFISLIGNVISEFIDKSTLNESEIAKVLYCYLSTNTDKNNIVLKQLGEKDFVDLVSNTLYAISTIKDMQSGNYELRNSTNSIQAALYQLGSKYTSVAKILGTSEMLERAFYLTWDYDDKYLNSDKLQEKAIEIRGKLGDLLLIIGTFMKKLTADDIYAYLYYRSLEESKEKNDYKIYFSLRFSKIILDAYSESKIYCTEQFNNITELVDCYAHVTITLHQLWSLSVGFDINDDDELIELTSEIFDSFANGCSSLNQSDFNLLDLNNMDDNSEEYKKLLNSATEFLYIENSISELLQNLTFALMGRVIYVSTPEEDTENE